MALVQRSEDNLQEPALSFYLVGPGNGAQTIRLIDKNLYPLNHFFEFQGNLVIFQLKTSFFMERWGDLSG